MSSGRDASDQPAGGIFACADALLRRHRGKSEEPAPAAGEADDIPVLTDIAPDPDLASGTLSPDQANAAEVEVISRVQNQNLQHSMYQKLRKDLDGRIAEVVREQFMPDIGTALDSAVQHITQEIRANLGELVRTSVEHALKQQLALPAAVGNGEKPHEGKQADVMSDTVEAPPAPQSELAKGFEPAAIESYWYPVWERN